MKLLALLIMIMPTLLWAKDDRMSFLDLYNHESHNEIFEASKFACKNCHTNDKAFTRATITPACHLCHNNPKPPAPAEQTCERCHNENLLPIKPKNHNPSWGRIHGAFAKQNGQQCAVCHRSSWCADCHQQRDSIRQTMHPRNFQFFHSVEARANPARCDRCHTVNFCTQCHTLRRIP